ncbi:hypothetical protein ACFFX0_18855 [Citricoccus parietis]|uniref:Uncharacterized protein n=1 Tax=Citricoccus parietis TaxID=592307 RepID=A0ABV5G2I4_9MICC
MPGAGRRGGRPRQWAALCGGARHRLPSRGRPPDHGDTQRHDRLERSPEGRWPGLRRGRASSVRRGLRRAVRALHHRGGPRQ